MMSPRPRTASDQRPRARLDAVDRGGHRQVVAAPERASASSSGVTSHGPNELAKSLPLAGPSRTAVSSRWRSRADQSLKIVYPPIASSARSGARSPPACPRRPRPPARSRAPRTPPAPDRIVGPADLRDVGEVEDRQPVPGLRDLAAAALPHRPDVALEGIEVTERRRAQDRRPEAQTARGQRARRRPRPRGANPSTSSRTRRSADRGPGGRRAS